MRKREQSVLGGPELQVMITGHLVNIRDVPGMQSEVIGTAETNELFPYIASETDETGTEWHKVVFNGSDGWVSGKFSGLVGK